MNIADNLNTLLVTRKTAKNQTNTFVYAQAVWWLLFLHCFCANTHIEKRGIGYVLMACKTENIMSKMQQQKRKNGNAAANKRETAANYSSKENTQCQKTCRNSTSANSNNNNRKKSCRHNCIYALSQDDVLLALSPSSLIIFRFGFHFLLSRCFLTFQPYRFSFFTPQTGWLHNKVYTVQFTLYQ